MLSPQTTLIIGLIAGFAMAYPLGFFMARGIYRPVDWLSRHGRAPR